MNRIQVLRESKFNKMTEVEMTEIKGGGICIRCLKRARNGLTVSIGITESGYTTDFRSVPIEKNKVSVFRGIN